MPEIAVSIRQRGQITLPKVWRDLYDLGDGRKMTITDLGGVFVLKPGESRVDALCDDLRADLVDAGATLEEMLADIRARREADGRQA